MFELSNGFQHVDLRPNTDRLLSGIWGDIFTDDTYILHQNAKRRNKPDLVEALKISVCKT